MSFVHLHTHSHYSLLTALPKVEDLLQAAKDYGMTALALTDTSAMYGAVEFYMKAKEYGIKPIIGPWVSRPAINYKTKYVIYHQAGCHPLLLLHAQDLR